MKKVVNRRIKRLRTRYEDVTLPSVCAILGSVNTPKSKEALQGLTSKGLSASAGISPVDPSAYTCSSDFKKDYLVSRLLKKVS